MPVVRGSLPLRSKPCTDAHCWPWQALMQSQAHLLHSTHYHFSQRIVADLLDCRGRLSRRERRAVGSSCAPARLLRACAKLSRPTYVIS